MLFNTLDFLIFFAVVVILHYTLPHKLRWIMMLIASCIFYMCWRAELIVLILFSSLSNWYIANKIYRGGASRRALLILSIVINFGLLFIFKYLMFFSSVLQSIYAYFGAEYPIGDFSVILPMGISFYTFQAASYTFDVYMGKYKPEKNYFHFALFITFFPQLVAGPIERADRLLNQLFTPKKWNTDNISAGAKLMLVGYFKKMVIADRAAVLVDAVFNSPQNYSGISFITAALMFTLQIYCDFSGYTDIARGCAKMLGIDLIINFDMPYFSKSIKEFWRRWHISLSSWFRDYVYILLGGNRHGTAKKYRNLLVTFAASGLWHGANYTFVIWGLLHGIYQVIGDIKDRFFKKIGLRTDFAVLGIFKMLITFCLAAFAWIFFRANNISDCIYIITNLFADVRSWGDKQYLYEAFCNMGLSLFEIVITVCAIAFLFLSEAISHKSSIVEFWDKRPFVLRFAYYFVLSVIILSVGVFSDGGQFIYFQF